MEIRSLHINDTADRQFVTLAEKDGERALTIVISWHDIQAIDRVVKKTPPARPMTHELLAGLLKATGATLERVDITDLKSGTYFAQVRLTRADGSACSLDARPSDALALAAALEKPVFVAEEVLAAVEGG
ncbi:MAG: bifunctional nuclease family protein [Planctomycetia bacterium]